MGKKDLCPQSETLPALEKVQLFGAMLAETVLAPVPHRHFTFTIPEMLRPYFRFHRGLIKELCRIAHRCLAEFLDYRVLTLLGTGLMGQLAAALGEGGEP